MSEALIEAHTVLEADKESPLQKVRRPPYCKFYEAHIQIGQMTFNWKFPQICDMKKRRQA